MENLLKILFKIICWANFINVKYTEKNFSWNVTESFVN